MKIETFFHEGSSTYTHVIIDPETQHCAIVDPVLDYDPKSGRSSTQSADAVIEYINSHQLKVDWILETHVHADHLSSAPYLKSKLGGKVAIGSKINQVQAVFKGVFNAEPEFATDGSQFDHLFDDNETFNIGSLTAKAWHTPGHTPACATYIVEEEAAFVGDTIFMPDMGTARCDFPGGSAEELFQSIGKILSLPEQTQLYMCHDYAPGGREHQFVTTVGDERARNIHVANGTAESDFVAMRSERDATLAMPVLLLPSVQINMRAGETPPAEDNGVSYLKIPLNAL
ncbi:beta-lactamase [Vibrio sp. qd031]|uniref:MBL fold metallo-hydrolase n=1 Tax=Vibrio sp. qd031 TaxID=1603038 RepID=UPI000A0FDA8E|nr:MBL fold metallo-hydrolase [Vibrio sp. qd031]ORT48691.1 beta-lactamase [Vibrio sp. qd031]